MVVVADASVAIRGDLSGFHADLRGAEKPVETLGGKLRGIFSPANVIGAAGMLGVGLGVRQLVGYAGEAAAAFTELQQTQRTTDEVFGNSASVIENWAQRSADAAGMSQRTVFQSAAVMGQTLINMGFSAEEAAEKVVILQQRAAEMGLAFGTTPERAILAITAAMRGERDTIEKFGVSIKQADVNSRVLSLGLDTSTTAAKKNAEAMAILDLVLEQTAGQAGRFADGQEDVATRMLVAQAKIQDAQLVIGQEVASIQLGAIKVASFLGEELDSFSLNFGDQVQTIIRLANESGVSFDVMKERIVNAMDLTGLSFPEVVATFSVEGIDISDRAEEEFMAAAQAAGAGVGAMADQIKLGGPVVAAEAGKVAGMLPAEILARNEEIREAGRQNVIEFAAGLIEKQNDPLLAFEAMVAAQETELTRGEEIARLKGQLTSVELAAGLNDEREGVKAAAQAARMEIVNRLNTLNGYAWGAGVATTLAQGILDNLWRARAASVALGSATGGQIRIESEPPDHSSPLYGITKWGGNLVKTFADGMYDQLSTASAASRALAGALSPSVGVPAWNSAPGSHDSLMAGGGGTVNYILNVEGLPVVVGSAEDVMARWKQLTSFSKDGVQ